MDNFEVTVLPPNINLESIAILKALVTATRALGELRGEIKKIPGIFPGIFLCIRC